MSVATLPPITAGVGERERSGEGCDGGSALGGARRGNGMGSAQSAIVV